MNTFLFCCAGHSFCRKHSEFSRPIYKYGYTDPVRVCLECLATIDAEVSKVSCHRASLARLIDSRHNNRLAWIEFNGDCCE